MGKVLVIKGADFSQNAVEKGANIEFSVTSGVVTLTFSNAYRCYYTTNGSTPTTGSNLYSAPFNVSENTTIKAILQNKTTGGLSQVFTYYYSGVPELIGDDTIYSGTDGNVGSIGVALRLFNGARANGQITEITIGSNANLYLHLGHLDQENNFIERISYPFKGVANSPVDLRNLNVTIKTGEIVMVSSGATYISSFSTPFSVVYKVGSQSNLSVPKDTTGNPIIDRTDKVCVTLNYKIQY